MGLNKQIGGDHYSSYMKRIQTLEDNINTLTVKHTTLGNIHRHCQRTQGELEDELEESRKEAVECRELVSKNS